MSTGENIRAARIFRGLTQKELAQKCGLATGTIQQYELDKRNPKFEQLEKIACALNLGYASYGRGNVGFYESENSKDPTTKLKAKNFNAQQNLVLAKAHAATRKEIDEFYLTTLKQMEPESKPDEKDTTPQKKTLDEQIENAQKRLSCISAIAAHFDGEEFTEDELEEIRRFVEFVKSKRKE